MAKHSEEKPQMIETGDSPKEIGENKTPGNLKEEEVMGVTITTEEKTTDPTVTGTREATPETDAATVGPVMKEILSPKLKMNKGIEKTHRGMMNRQEEILGEVLPMSLSDCALEKKSKQKKKYI